MKPNRNGIWAVDRTSTGWSAARYVGEGMFVSSDSSGQLYITNLRTNPNNLAKVTLANGLFTNYETIRAGAHPCIAPDGSFLVYDINSGTHLMVCFREGSGNWGPAIDLTQHGLPSSAGIATISPDGKYLFYMYNGDIYWVSTDLIKNLK
jgi:Tol biopolymer transport system component